MKIKFLPLLTLIFLPTKVFANIDPKIREACMPAADFAGCVKTLSKPIKESKRFDFLGKPIIPGWYMQEDVSRNVVTYSNFKNIKKVKVRNTYGRYIGIDYVTRWYQDPVAGRSGSSTTIGPSYTNCSAYGSSISCDTFAPQTIDIPGRSPIPGGVRQARKILVIDCKENTFLDSGGVKKGKWKEIYGPLIEIKYRNCFRVYKLNASQFDKLEKGKPNKKDKEYLEELEKYLNKEILTYGFTIVPSKDRKIMIIGNVLNDMPAGKILKFGDQIVSINGKSLKGPNFTEIGEMKGDVGKIINLQVKRKEEFINISLTNQKVRVGDVI